MPLKQPVTENAIFRDGYQPFKHTIGDLLNELAKRSLKDAYVRDDLEHLRQGKTPRNGMK